MSLEEIKRKPELLEDQEAFEKAIDAAGLRPGIFENLGRLANSPKSARARYDCLRCLPAEVLQRRFLEAQGRLARLDSENAHHQVQVRRLEADIELYRRVARERGIPLDVRDEMLLLDEALRQPDACAVPSTPTIAAAALQTESAPEGGAALGSQKQRRRPGPKPDYGTASRVDEVVARVAPDGDWRSKLDAVCEALDEGGVACSKKWRKDRTCPGWQDQLEKPLVIKAIDYWLRRARRRKETPPETLS